MAEVSMVIESYSEEDAIRQGMLKFRKITKIEKVKRGFQPTNVKVVNRKQKGPKKWVTKFYIYSYQSKQITSDGKEIYVGLKLEAEGEKGKTEALQKAKELCMWLQKPMTVRVVKVLQSGSNVVGEVLPHGRVLGQYRITGIPKQAEEILQEEMKSGTK